MESRCVGAPSHLLSGTTAFSTGGRRAYLEHLEGAFLVRRLAPLEVNLRKRLVKALRLYWLDSGLLHSLLHLPPGDDLLAQPWVGASWEGFVIEQILSVLTARGETVDPFFSAPTTAGKLTWCSKKGRNAR